MPCSRLYFLEALVFFCLIFCSSCNQHTQPNEENLERSSAKANQTNPLVPSSIPINLSNSKCSPNQECRNLIAPCLNCTFDYNCTYGSNINVTCSPLDSIQCRGERKFERVMMCRYCYQTDHWEHTCVQKGNCNAVAAPKIFYRTNCSVKDDIICFGSRTFKKNLPCNWTGGYRWSTAVILSITLGGFGADRFYLGHWQEGIGKLFSFGGLGVWTLIDVILISLRYLGPADGSLYI